jgi:predicted TIM-barrel fold metal-dependent hydrolase
VRIIDLHCYPGTREWIECQGPYVAALATYWKHEWKPRTEEQVIADFAAAGVEACLVALDLETTIHTKPAGNDYVHAMWQRHKGRIVQCWGTVDPFKETAIAEARHAIEGLGLMGFHFHPIMQHFAVDDPRFRPLFETIAGLKVPVMIDVGTTGMGAGMPGGMGAIIRHAHPSAIDVLAANFPTLKIVCAHPGWPWIDEMTAVALHKGNVYWEMSGWAPKYLPDGLKRDMRGRLKDKVMFGSDYPSLPYERLFREWGEVGFSSDMLEKFYHGNAEAILGL